MRMRAEYPEWCVWLSGIILLGRYGVRGGYFGLQLGCEVLAGVVVGT